MKLGIAMAAAMVLGGCAPTFSTTSQTYKSTQVVDVKADETTSGQSWVTLNTTTTDVIRFYVKPNGEQVRLYKRSAVAVVQSGLWLCTKQVGGAPLCQQARWGLKKGESAKPATAGAALE